MEKKNNISVEEFYQLMMEIDPSMDGLPSEDLQKAHSALNLLIEDFEKARDYVEQLQRVVSDPLEFNGDQIQTPILIENLKTVTQRATENYQYTGNLLQEVYVQAVQLKGVISESISNIDERFTFWMHSFLARDTKEIPTFSEFLELVTEDQTAYTYFLAPFGVTPLLICQYIPIDMAATDLELSFSTYVAPPTGFLRTLKRGWNKLFGSPNTILFHVFRHSTSSAELGTFKQRSQIEIQPYSAYQHNKPDQLPKIIYDFINFYGIAERQHVHLLKGADRFALFMTGHPIQFSDRFVQLSGVDVGGLGESFRNVHRLVIE